MNAPTNTSMLTPSVWLEIHPKLGIALIDHLFNRLEGSYQNRWRASFSSMESIRNWRDTWAEAFDDEKLTPAQVSAGLKACRVKFDWPPSLAEFLKACKPPINIDSAVYEAIEQMRARQESKDVWSNPAIFWAAVKVGEFDILSQTFAQLKPRLEAALQKVMEGEVQPVPPRVPMLASPGKAESTREYGHQRLQEIGASGAMKNMSKGGNIEWARKIIAEEKETGKVPLNKLRIAKEAIFNVTGKEV